MKMAGDMESILFKGDDSSSGESDTEPQTSSVPQPNTSVVNNNNRPVQSTGQVPRPDSSTGPMSQSEMAQRLKSMYSPASKAASGPSSAVQPGLPSMQAVSAQPNMTMTTQQIPQHRPQQQVPQQPQKVPVGLTSYRPSSAGESAQLQQQQQQQRSGIQHPLQRGGNQPQQLQQRPGGGITHPQQINPLVSSAQHPSDQQTRPRMHQMQAPSIPHRPSNRLPHQQQSVRQGQPQGTIAPIRNPPSSLPTQSVQQISMPRSNNYNTNVSQQQHQQSQQANTMDRGVMEKKQKERFLVFTRVLMVRQSGLMLQPKKYDCRSGLTSLYFIFTEIFGNQRSSIA